MPQHGPPGQQSFPLRPARQNAGAGGEKAARPKRASRSLRHGLASDLPPNPPASWGVPRANPARIGTARSDNSRSSQARHPRQSSHGQWVPDAVRVSHCGTPSNRAGWFWRVWKGKGRSHSGASRAGRSSPSAEALPQGDRTQSSDRRWRICISALSATFRTTLQPDGI